MLVMTEHLIQIMNGYTPKVSVKNNEERLRIMALNEDYQPERHYVIQVGFLVPF